MRHERTVTRGRGAFHRGEQTRTPSLRIAQNHVPDVDVNASQNASDEHTGAQNESPDCVVEHRVVVPSDSVAQHELPATHRSKPPKHVGVDPPEHRPPLHDCPPEHDPHELPKSSAPHVHPSSVQFRRVDGFGGVGSGGHAVSDATIAHPIKNTEKLLI